MEDILGLGKILPLDKLIDVISKAVGRVTKSYFDRKDVRTAAYEIKTIAEARAEELKIISDAIGSSIAVADNVVYANGGFQVEGSKQREAKLLQDTINHRVLFQEAKRQLNIENITAFAAEDLKQIQSVSSEPVDDDWTTRFFSIASDISNEEMQRLWGRILAGEVKRPQSYSLRTLELLKNLIKSEAEIFTRIARARVESSKELFLYNNDKGKLLKEEFNISFSDILLMTELGLIVSESNLALRLQGNENVFFNFGKTMVVVDRSSAGMEQTMSVVVFTKSGRELSTLIDQEPTMPYIQSVCRCLTNKKVSVQHGDIEVLPSGELNVTNRILYEDPNQPKQS